MTVQVTTPQGPIRGSAGDLTATGVEVIPQGPPGDVGTGGAVSSVNSRTGAVVLTSADVGLANVNNTSDANKPVSTAQAAADAAVLASANATTAAHAARTDNPHTVTAAQLGLGNVENKSSATIRSEITSGNVTTALGYTPENAAQKGTAGGYAPLDGTGKVASTYLPSTDAVPEGASNLYFTAARVLATVLSGLSTATNAVITVSDTVLGALGKLQKQISDNLTTLTNHTSNTSNPHATTAAQVGAVSTGAVTTSGLTMSTARLLGRNTASTGAIEEITLGTNLSLSGTTLNASGALTNFTEAVNTAAPNATVPVVSLTATNAATNVDIALVPKGTGAITAQIADGTVTGGNKRGAGAVDLQMSRSNAAQVASGANSFIVGVDNTVSGGQSAAIGIANNVSGSLCFASGLQNTVSSGGGYGSAFGCANSVSGTCSMTIGFYNTADADFSIAAGWYATSRGIASTMQHAGSRRVADGDRQFRRIPQSTVTSNATATVLTSTGAAESTGNTWVLPNNYSGILHGFVVARNTANNDTIGWEVKAMVTRDSSAASVAILGSASVAAVGTADAAMSSCSLAVGANTTNGSITLTATGIAATTIAWSGYIHCIENG